MKKNMNNIPTTASVMAAIAQGARADKEQSIATAAEQEERANSMRTQGRKGCKLSRYNLGLTPRNKEFIRVMAKATGRSQNEFINLVLEAYQKEHPEIMDKAKYFISMINDMDFVGDKR